MPNIEQQSNFEGGERVEKEAEKKIELTPEQEKVKQRVINALDKENLNEARYIIEDSNLPERAVKEAAEEAMMHALYHTDSFRNAQFIKMRYNLSEEFEFINSTKVRELLKKLVKEFIKNLQFNIGPIIQDQFNLPQKIFQQAAMEGMVILFRYENGVDYAMKAQSQLNLPVEMLSSVEIQEPVKIEMTKCLAEDNFDKACKIKEMFKIPDQVLAQGIEEVIEQEKLLPILTNLDVIPESVLRLLENKYFLLTYKQNLALASEEIYNQYRGFKQEGDEIQLAGFIEKIKSQTESLISNEPQNPEISEQEYYQDLVRAVYPNHAESRTDYENNESCPDRSGDLDNFEIKDVYEIDLREGVEMEMKPGQEKDEPGLSQLEKPIAGVQQKFSQVEFNKEKMFEILDREIDEKLDKCQNKEVFKTREEKIYGLLLEGLAGRQNPQDLKEILIGYQFAEFEDIKAYLEGTRAQAEQAKNPGYAYLLELREFFADHLKEVERKIANKGQKNQEISELLPAYYQEKKEAEQKRTAQEKLDKAQISKLGLTEGFLKQLGRSLKGKTGKDYSLEQIKRIAHLYETFSMGLEQKQTTSPKERTKAVYGQLRSQRKKSFKALQDIIGQEIEPENIHLGELNLQELLETRESFSEKGEYDEELFSRYLVQAFQSVFEDELSVIDQELAKYQPKEEDKRDKKQKQLECFITKNHTSAHARGVGGVCVAGDNPMKAEKAGRPEQECQWNLPNYFQMVLRDKETKICQGLVLLHHYEDQGKKILTAAFDPSSTYLYAVDERQLFNNLLGQLETFAKDNDIDIIAVSQNKAMRTNRSGGEFERAMETAIRKANQNFSLSKEETFSFDPVYKQKDLDVIWVKS